ncbi:MAG: Uma2 family endonuclease [Methylococcales bacterium]
MPKISHLDQLDLNQSYNYADYLTWQLKETVELIKGKIMLMSPAPNVRHQDISSNLMGYLLPFFKYKECRVYAAPFDVRLYERKKSLLKKQEITTVVQPDLCVICQPELLDKQGCNGAPDWIIEILSKGNSTREVHIKYQLYQESGVTEYWMVFPEHQTIHQFVLNEQQTYQLKQMYTNDDIAVPTAFS